MAQKVKTYSFHCVIALIAISFPMLVAFMDKDNKPNLVGIVISDEKPKFSWTDWFNGIYQEEYEDYNNDHWAFKETSVRLNNQFYYEAFNQIRVNNFVIGKEDYIFSIPFIYSAFGDDAVEEQEVAEKLRKAKVIQDTLKKKGIDLIIGLAPGKGKYCIEYVPDKYKHPVKMTSYQLFLRYAAANGLNVLDLYSYFEKLKPVAEYPLFPKFGHHWSYYGECLASKTIIEYIEKLRKTDMPDIIWEKIDVVDTARSRDADALKSMNLYKNPPQNMKLAYPELQFENDSLKNRTRVLTVGDSYWYGPVYMGVPQNCLAGGEFWYYFNRVVPSRVAGQKLEVWELDLKQELERNNVIMLLYSDGNLYDYGNTFFDDVYELYTSPKTYYARQEKDKLIMTYTKQIRETPVLLKKSTRKSKELVITLDSAIKQDAMRMAGLIK
jgi:hypothetical protein